MKRCLRILLLVLVQIREYSVAGQTCVIDSNANNNIIQLSHINDINGLPQNSVKGIWKDGLGFIWIGTEQGLVRYDGANFITLTNQFKNSERVLFFVVSDHLKSLFVVNEYREVLKIDNGKCQYLGFDNVQKGKGKHTQLYLDVEKVNSFSIINKGELKYYARQLDISQRAIVWQKSDKILSIPIGDFEDVFSFGEKDYILTTDFKFEAFNPSLTKQIHSDIKFIGFTYDSCNRLFTYNNNLYLLQRHGRQFSIKLVQRAIEQLNELSCFYYDEKSRLLFIGTMSNGLFVYKVNAGVFAPPIDVKQSLYAQVLIDDDCVLSKDYVFSATTFKKFNFPYQVNHFASLLDHHQKVYVPTFKHGVFSFDRQAPFQKLQVAFNEVEVEYIQEDKDYRIWLADRGLGLSVYDNTVKSKYQLLKRYGYLNTPEGNLCFHKLINSYLFFNDKTLYYVNQQLEITDSLAFKNDFKVRNICALDGLEGVLLLTYGNGIVYVSEKKNVVQLPLDDNHYLNFSHGLFVDESNRVWITTNKGLFSVASSELLNYLKGKQKTLLYYHVDHTSGLQTNEFNGGCYPTFVRLKDGYFSLPTITGLTMVRPEELIALPVNSGIVVDKIKILDLDCTHQSHLVLNEGNVDLKFSFSVVYWGNRENIEFEYQIIGLDSNWKKLKNPYALEFRYLPCGDYTINLRVRDKLYSNQVFYKTITLEVLPLFYHTWWFIVLMILLLVVLVFLIVKIRSKKILAMNKNLEDMVTERTMKLMKQNKTINDNLDILKRKQELLNQSLVIKNRTLSVFSHNIVGPLKFISIVLNDAINNKKIDMSNIEALDKTAKSLLSHSKELLEWTKMQEEKIVIKWEEIDVLEFVNVKLRLFEFLLKSAKISTNIIVPEGLKIKTDSVIMNIILFNLIDNTIKYAPNSTMTIEFKVNNKSLCFKFKDTGKGMSSDVKHHLNELNLDVIRQKEPKSNSIGWFIISECVFLLNGEYKIREDDSTGFEVDFEFPLVIPSSSME